MPPEVVPFLPAALECEVQAALAAAAIHDIGSYGWLNEWDTDPEFIGHAMWQTEQPHLNLKALIGDSPVSRRPSDVEKQILTLGEDFCGLMQSSRLSIGLALVWTPHAKRNVLNESQYLWLHHTDACLKLAIASDRLRDLLVVACTGKRPKDYKDLSKKNRRYVTPFQTAGTLLADRGLQDQRLSEPLKDLPKHAGRIYVEIKHRNAIVHEVATRMACSVHGSLTKLQHDFDLQEAHGFTPRSHDFKDWSPSAHERLDELRNKIDQSVARLRDWYALLIDASNAVFQVEYWSRTLGPK